MPAKSLFFSNIRPNTGFFSYIPTAGELVKDAGNVAAAFAAFAYENPLLIAGIVSGLCVSATQMETVPATNYSGSSFKK